MAYISKLMKNPPAPNSMSQGRDILRVKTMLASWSVIEEYVCPGRRTGGRPDRSSICSTARVSGIASNSCVRLVRVSVDLGYGPTPDRWCAGAYSCQPVIHNYVGSPSIVLRDCWDH